MANDKKLDTKKLEELVEQIDAKQLEISAANEAAVAAGKLLDKLLGERDELRRQFYNIVLPYTK